MQEASFVLPCQRKPLKLFIALGPQGHGGKGISHYDKDQRQQFFPQNCSQRNSSRSSTECKCLLIMDQLALINVFCLTPSLALLACKDMDGGGEAVLFLFMYSSWHQCHVLH